MENRYLFTIRRSIITFIIGGLLIFVVGAVYIGTPSLFQESSKPATPYNVILLSIGTLRFDHLGAYGYTRDTSPNIDAFARENILFEQAISQSPFKISGYASLFTSQYPAVHKAVEGYELYDRLDSSKLTIAEVLNQYGYKTAAFGGTGQSKSPFGFPQGFDVYDDGSKFLVDIIPQATKWLARNKDDKVFLFILGQDAHHPSPEPFDHVFDPSYNGVIIKSHSELAPRLHSLKKYEGKLAFATPYGTFMLAEEDIDHLVAHYDGGILYVDFLIQQFFDTLKELEMYNNSIIVILSGHGETLFNFMERPTGLDSEHRDLYEEAIRVPLIIKHPDLPSRNISTQAQLIDIFPTILDFLNISLPKEATKQIQGRSLIPLIEGKAPAHFNEYTYGSSEGIGRHSSFIRTNHWKFISKSLLTEKKFELYNLQDDPQEMRNVIDQQPDIAGKLQQELEKWNFLNLLK